MFIWDFVASTILEQIMDWVYSQIIGFLGNFFAEMGNMGAELFEMSWVTQVRRYGMDAYTASDMDIRAVDPAALVDIRDVKVNTALPKRERILDFIRQIGNPYCYRHGKYVVRVSFADTDVSLEDRLEAYIRTKG